MRAVTAADRILIVSPHPDDESLCCGGLIREAIRTGAHVAIVWMTNGDAFHWDAVVIEKKLRPRAPAYLDLARQRVVEARAAAGVLGVPEEFQYFLGYPDRGLLKLLFDHFYPETPWRSKFTGESAVAYAGAVDPGAQFNGANLELDFISVVERERPTLVFAPSPQDTHPDHRATGLLAMRVMSARKEAGRLRYWIVHGGRGWPKPRNLHPELAPTVPPRGRGMLWETYAIDADAQDVKVSALRAHRTQLKVMGKTMMGYVRAAELYSLTPVPAGTNACLKAQPCEFEVAPVEEKAGL